MIFCSIYFPLCILIGIVLYYFEIPDELLNMNKPDDRAIIEKLGVSLKKVNVYKIED